MHASREPVHASRKPEKASKKPAQVSRELCRLLGDDGEMRFAHTLPSPFFGLPIYAYEGS